MASRQLIRIGVDTGGTFTDFVFERDGQFNLFKLPSTPSDPSLAIQQGLNRICDETGARLDRIEVVHGTTVGTNALLQRRGARIALVARRGRPRRPRDRTTASALRTSFRDRILRTMAQSLPLIDRQFVNAQTNCPTVPL